MSTISNSVYGSDWYNQYKNASNVQYRNVSNSVSSTETAANDSFTVDPLENLVDSGTITEEQEDAIKKAFESAASSSSYSRFKIQSNTENTESSDPLETLVDNGTITEEQKNSVKDLLDSQMEMGNMPPPPPQQQGNSQNSLESSLDELVSAGTITEDQKSDVLKALQSAFETGSTGVSSGDSSSNKTTDPLQTLVEAGTITEEQKSAIKSTLDESIKSKNMPPPPPPSDEDQNSIDSTLESLVNSGAITDDQKTSIIEALNAGSESDTDSYNETYLNGLSNLFNALKVSSDAYELQFEAGQVNNTTNSMEVTL